MADAAKPNSSADAATALPAKTAWWKSLLTPRWLVVFVAVSLVIHSAIFILVRRAAARPAPPSEYTVGAFALTAVRRVNYMPCRANSNCTCGSSTICNRKPPRGL